MTDRAKSRITRRVLAARSGASRSQLTHWINNRWIPSVNGKVGSGNHRIFTEDDVAATRLAVEAVNEYGPEAAGRVLLRYRQRLADGDHKL